jgi:hypothetical protein
MWSRTLLIITIVCTGCSKSPDESTAADTPAPKEKAAATTPHQASIAAPAAPTPGIANAPLDPMKKRVAARFEKWFGAMQQEAMPIAKARTAWRESWLGSYDAPLASSSNPRVQQGAENPPEVATIKPPAKPYVLQIAEGKFDLAANEQEQESMTCLHMLLAGVMLQGGYQLPELLNDRFDELPPNRGDLFTFQLVQDAAQLRERSGSPITPDQAAAWERMSQAKNPIYRQLALKVYPRLAATNEAVLKFLQACGGETDAQNIMLMVSSAAALPDGIGLDYLKSLQAGNFAKSQPGAATAIAASIEDIEQRRR